MSTIFPLWLIIGWSNFLLIIKEKKLVGATLGDVFFGLQWCGQGLRKWSCGDA
jgi:hypothetical protein